MKKQNKKRNAVRRTLETTDKKQLYREADRLATSQKKNIETNEQALQKRI